MEETTITYPYVVEMLCGKDWIRTVIVPNQKQADFWVNEFKKVGIETRILPNETAHAQEEK